MTLVEWIRTVRPDRASKVLATYALIMAVLQLVLQVSASIADGGLANGAPVVAWALLWWNARQKNFRAIFNISVVWMALQVLAAIVLVSMTNTQNLNSSNREFLFFGTIAILMVWWFPAAVAQSLKKRLPETDAEVSDALQDKEVENYYQTEKNTAPVKRYDNENAESINDNVKRDKENINSKLSEKYKEAWVAIQYRPEAGSGWKQIQTFPVSLKLRFLEKLTHNPQQDIESLLAEIIQQHQEIIEPFKDKKLDRIYSALSKENTAAAHEFKRVIDILGKTVDPTLVAHRLMNRYGEIGKILVANKEMLGRVVHQNAKPTDEFKKVLESEFSSFVEEKKLQNKSDQDAWRLFIDHLFDICGWEATKLKSIGNINTLFR